MEVIMVLAWLLLPLIPASIASRKGHSGGLYYLFGLFFFLPALIVALLIPPKRPLRRGPRWSHRRSRRPSRRARLRTRRGAPRRPAQGSSGSARTARSPCAAMPPSAPTAVGDPRPGPSGTDGGGPWTAMGPRSGTTNRPPSGGEAETSPRLNRCSMWCSPMRASIRSAWSGSSEARRRRLQRSSGDSCLQRLRSCCTEWGTRRPRGIRQDLERIGACAELREVLSDRS